MFNFHIPFPKICSENFEFILGLKFWKKDLTLLLKELKVGHFLIAPSAPSILDICEHVSYREAVQNADIAIADSGLMCICWNLMNPSKKVCRISGYRFLWMLIDSGRLCGEKTSFWVMASKEDEKAAIEWLNKEKGFSLNTESTYIAPRYLQGDIIDPILLNRLNEQQPPFIILNIGGGTQERLGYFLRKNLVYSATIICTGAALGFMTGRQTYIPDWADACYLGWLWRCVGNPKLFIPRYVKGLLFIPLFLRFRNRLPDLR